jgi:hypothetical protein
MKSWFVWLKFGVENICDVLVALLTASSMSDFAFIMSETVFDSTIFKPGQYKNVTNIVAYIQLVVSSLLIQQQVKLNIDLFLIFCQ